MRIVLDTNVLVSALMTPHGAPAAVVSNILAGRLALLFDERILDEYRAVLTRPRVAFDPGQVDTLLGALEGGGSGIGAAPLDIDWVDPDDAPFLEVAVTGQADALVTGNLKHFPNNRVPIVTPAVLMRKDLSIQM